MMDSYFVLGGRVGACCSAQAREGGEALGQIRHMCDIGPYNIN